MFSNDEKNWVDLVSSAGVVDEVGADGGLRGQAGVLHAPG